VQTNSIYCAVSFDDDEEQLGTVYHVSGYRVTGFVEDEYQLVLPIGIQERV